MKRECQATGSYFRETKQSAWPQVKVLNKGNNGKCNGKCGSNGRARCKACAFALPVDKALNKTKGNGKGKAFNITRNYKMQDWRVCDSSPPSSSSKKPILKVERPSCDWDRYAEFDVHNQSDGESDDETQQFNELDQGSEQPDSLTSKVVWPIESLLRTRKISVSRISPASEEQKTDEDVVDSDDSWSGVEMSDIEDEIFDDGDSWADDWSLVEEMV